MKIDKPTINDFTNAPHTHSDAINGGLIIDNNVEINIDFTVVTPLVYNVPKAMMLTSQISEGSAATLSTPLNTNMPKYRKLIITPTQIGLVTLIGHLN